MLTRKQKNFYNLLVIIPFFLLLFQSGLTSNLNLAILNYIDEMYLLFLAVFNLIQKKCKLTFDKDEKIIFIGWIIFVTAGAISSVINQYQSVALTLSDIFVCSKFIICYFGMKNMLGSLGCEYVSNSLYKLAKKIIVIHFVLTIINCFIPIFPVSDYRYFMHSIKLFYGHPTGYAAVGVSLLCIILFHNFYEENIKDCVYVVLDMLCICASLRTKAISAVAIIILIYFYFKVFNFRNYIFLIIIAVIMAISIGWDSFTFYFNDNYLKDNNFVRMILLVRSIGIANSNFPLGVGFASFGSNIAAEHFSPVYVKLGIVYGAFLSDSFWPIVIGQCGYLGLCGFILIIVGFTKKAFALLKSDFYLFYSFISVLIYEVICSIAESAFFHPLVCTLFMLCGMVAATEQRCKKHSREIKNDT